jgi:hypothetical protein
MLFNWEACLLGCTPIIVLLVMGCCVVGCSMCSQQKGVSDVETQNNPTHSTVVIGTPVAMGCTGMQGGVKGGA